MSQAVYNLIITAYYFWLTQALTLNIVTPNTIKARASLACLGWYPVYPACVQSAALWRTSAVKLLLVLLDPHHCPDSMLHNPSPLCTLWCPPAATQISPHWHITQWKHTNICCPPIRGWAYDGWPSHLWTHPFCLHPPLPGYSVHIQMRYWVKITLTSYSRWHKTLITISLAPQRFQLNSISWTESYLFAWAVGIYRLTDT